MAGCRAWRPRLTVVHPHSSSARPIALALVLVALAAAGVVMFSLNASRETTVARDAPPVEPGSATATARSAAGSGSAANAIASQRGAAVVNPSPAPRAVRGSVSAARDAFERARSLGAVFNALRGQSDADALFFAQRALRECMPYVLSGAPAGQAPALDRYRPAPPDDPMTARRQESYAALQARCSGFDLGADPAAAARALREAVLASNDPRALLEQAAMGVRRGTPPADAMEKVRTFTANGDPYAIEQAGAVMSALRGRYVFVLDGQVVKPDIVAAGWMLAACDAGRSCGGEWVQAPCAFLTECDARDLESSLQRYQLTPSEFDAMQQVRARVTRGVASGQWDASLFTPQPAPPLYRRWGP